VIGDGSANCLTYPHGLHALSSTVCELLRDSGLLILRCYLQTEPHESATDLLAGALDGEIPNFHEFKLRLLMALQTSPTDGVAVHDVYQWLNHHAGFPSLSWTTVWTRAEVETLHHYDGSPTVYSFPVLGDLRSAFGDGFDEIANLTPSHPVGSRCPILVFQRRCRA
jgi:hypothetical protein